MIVFTKSHPATRTMIGGDPTPEQAQAGEYPKLREKWHGLTLAIEHPEGTVREGVDETGKPWRTVFRYAYGEIIGTLGLDGDPVDVFIGSMADAPMVYIVQQMKRKQWDTPDEQKCMINFASLDEAKAAYLGHYDDPRFFGGITEMPVDEFIAKVRATKGNGSMIKSAEPVVLFLKARVGAYMRNGKMVNVNGYQGRNAQAVAAPGQLSLFGGAEKGKKLGPSPYAGKDPVKDTMDMFADADEHGEVPPARPAAAQPAAASAPVAAPAPAEQEKPQHVTDTPQFKNWFGDSKVVGKDGKPLVVHHGSQSRGVTVFDTSRKTTRGDGDEAGTYFSSDPMTAYNYTQVQGQKERGSVTAAYLSIQNPLDTTADIKKFQKKGMTFGEAKREALKKLDRSVHDGIIFQGNSYNPAEYVVFKPEQIKSATGNSGAFDATHPDMTKSILFVRRKAS